MFNFTSPIIVNFETPRRSPILKSKTNDTIRKFTRVISQCNFIIFAITTHLSNPFSFSSIVAFVQFHLPTLSSIAEQAFFYRRSNITIR